MEKAVGNRTQEQPPLSRHNLRVFIVSQVLGLSAIALIKNKNKRRWEDQQEGCQQPTSIPLPSSVIDCSTTTPTFSQIRAPKKARITIEDIYEDSTNRLISYLEPPVSQSVEPTSSPKYHSAAVEFVAETLGKLSKEEADACEKELMQVATKYRYNY